MTFKPSIALGSAQRSTLQILAVVLLTLALATTMGCTPPRAAGTAAEAKPGGLPHGVSAADASAYLAAHPEALVLDVRSPGEWNDDVGHIDRAKLIPITELPSRMGEIAEWKSKPVIIVCRVGARSAAAATMLRTAGFGEVANLEGGMEAWRRAGF